MCTTEIIIKNSVKEIEEYVLQSIRNISSKSIEERSCFTLGVSGGSLINILSETLAQEEINWKQWKIFMCDERLVPQNNSDNTFGQYKEKLIDPLNCGDSWYPVNTSLEPSECAKDYENTMRQAFAGQEFPSFDLLLLGMGPDGHTCSLFPNHELLQEKERWIAPITNSPKPPPCRITMTLPVVNHAYNVTFVSTGSSKADTLKHVLLDKSKPELPVQLVKPKNGNLIWLLDQPAASKLQNT